jgi:hypothetical protein
MEKSGSKSPGKTVVSDPSCMPGRLLFCARRVSEFPTPVSLHLVGGAEKTQGTGVEKFPGRPATATWGKNGHGHSDKHMRITVNTADLTGEQMKFLSLLGALTRTYAGVADRSL